MARWNQNRTPEDESGPGKPQRRRLSFGPTGPKDTEILFQILQQKLTGAFSAFRASTAPSDDFLEQLQSLLDRESAVSEIRVVEHNAGPKVYIAVDGTDLDRDRRIIEFLIKLEESTGTGFDYALVAPETIGEAAADAGSLG